MTVTVDFDDALRAKLGGPQALELSATTVHGALIQVAQAYPALHMFNCEGELRSILKIRKNELPVTVKDALADGDTLLLYMGA